MSESNEPGVPSATEPKRIRISRLAMLVTVIAAAFAAWIFIAAQSG